jgi:hypothetical protein
MSVHPTDTTPVYTACLQKAQDLFLFEQLSLGQRFQHTQNVAAFLQRSTCQLTYNKWMAEDLLVKQQSF